MILTSANDAFPDRPQDQHGEVDQADVTASYQALLAHQAQAAQPQPNGADC